MGEEMCGMIHPEAKFLSSCESGKPDKFCAFKIQRWDRHKMDIAIPKGEIGKKKGVMGSQASQKFSKANSIGACSLKIILFSSRSHFLGQSWWQRPSHSSVGSPALPFGETLDEGNPGPINRRSPLSFES